MLGPLILMGLHAINKDKGKSNTTYMFDRGPGFVLR